MSDKADNIGDTLSSGIQDVAALLPLLGTEQCERHVGSALEKGYIYAAASVLSLFGSLGTVKVGFTTLLATITFPFYGGRWLDFAGFATPGSVSSLVTMDESVGRYRAEIKLEKLLKEQHIDDPSMVKGFDLKSIEGKPQSSKFTSFSWNTMLVLSSFVSAIFSLSPYLYLMDDKWDRPTSWIYPLLRAFGSFLCVISIQLALQLRMHHVVNTSLAWLKIQKKHGFKDDIIVGQSTVLEERIRSRISIPKTSIFFYAQRPASDEEKQPNVPLSAEEHAELAAVLAIDWYLILYQLVIVLGMAMILAGYVGCFSLVGQTGLPSAPYVWFGLETALSVLRIFLWGSNPHWDQSVGLTMSLQLHPLHHSGSNRDVETLFPVVTSPHQGHLLGIYTDRRRKSVLDTKSAFIAHSESDFLSVATAFVGPLQRLESSALTLLYSVIAKGDEKFLYTTIYFTNSRPPLTFWESEVYTSILETVPNTGAVQVTVGDLISKSVDAFLDTPLYHEVVSHSRSLSTRLFGGEQRHTLDVKWNLLAQQIKDASKENPLTSKQLSKLDREYLDLRMSWSAKTRHCNARETILQELSARDAEYREKPVVSRVASHHGEAMFIIESLVLELQVWRGETFLAKTSHSSLSRQMIPECIRAMQLRVLMEKQRATARYIGYQWKGEEVLGQQWDFLLQKLLQLRESEYLGQEAEKLLDVVSSLSLNGDMVLSINKLERHLSDFTSLGTWLPAMAGLSAEDFDQHADSMKPAPQEKVELMLHLMLHRLQRLKSGRDPKRLVNDISSISTHVPDSASWGPYIHCFTSEVLRRNTRCIAVEFVPHSEFEDTSQAVDSPVTVMTSLNELTTVIVRSSVTTDDTRTEVQDLVTSNPNIVCLSGMECSFSEECDEVQCKAIVANREAWKVKAESGSSFVYRAGFEGDELGQITVKGDTIELAETARSFVAFFCPGPGTLTLTFHGREKDGKPTGFEARIRSNELDDITTVFVDKSDDFSTERVTFEFSGVSRGSGEIYVTNLELGIWEIHGLVDLKWTEEP